MTRLLAAAAVLAAVVAGAARADTFEVVGEEQVAAPLALPSAAEPNAPGMLLLPPNVFEAPFGPVRELPYAELQALWHRAGAAYGVPWQVLAAINKIESNFGRNMGPSSAGAVGWMQFMPETWLRWGTDGSGDGIADPWDPEDAILSAARYLAAAGAATDLPRAIFAYNHAQWYVDDVLELAALFGDGETPSGAVFELDRLATAVDAAQAALLQAQEAVAAAEARETELRAAVERAAMRANDFTLLVSDRLTAQKEHFAAQTRHAEALAEVERLRAALTDAEAVVEQARAGAEASSFAPAASRMLAAPAREDGYVFPVLGGPSIVSVAHGHHDYPAADIAAPSGAPVVALADAVVLSIVDDSRCGIGLILRTEEGLTWVYCHLLQRDPSIVPGSFLEAGRPVGLVGSTGNSTGPHLHLGLKPARYPQEMPWFEQYAGVAFSWQDAPTPTPSGGPVFASPAEPSDDVVDFTLTRG